MISALSVKPPQKFCVVYVHQPSKEQNLVKNDLYLLGMKGSFLVMLRKSLLMDKRKKMISFRLLLHIFILKD